MNQVEEQGGQVDHRGTAVLVLGILGLVLCVICSIIAWVMANEDLRQMAEGRMDPSGEGITKAGKILAIVAVVLNAIGLVFFLLAVVGAVTMGAASA